MLQSLPLVVSLQIVIESFSDLMNSTIGRTQIIIYVQKCPCKCFKNRRSSIPCSFGVLEFYK